MIIYKSGPISTFDGKSKDIDVKLSNSKHGLRDILIGGGVTLAGIAYLTIMSFINGAKAFEDAEYNTMEELGLFSDSSKAEDH